jgi:hypothetical protein
MKTIRLTVLMEFVLLLCAHDIRAQETVAASGCDASGSSGSISFTAGQLIYETLSDTAGTVLQGVQLPNEIYIVTGIEEPAGIGLEMVIYPNPASEFLRLTITNYSFEKLSYRLSDMNGNLLQSGEITGRETLITTGTLPPAGYFLVVTDQDNVVKAFKIIKN